MPVPRPVPIPRGEAVPRNSDGGYLLALSWSPQYCASVRDPLSVQNRDQCGTSRAVTERASARHAFGWVMHGLWPQAAKGAHPRWCRAARIVPKDVLRKNFCASPSVQLMQAQWAKHGTCMSATPAAYFASASRIFGRLKFPDMARLAQMPQNSGSIRRAFRTANPGLRDSMFTVTTDKQGWLREVRLCLDRQMRPKVCSAGQQGSPDGRRVWIRH